MLAYLNGKILIKGEDYIIIEVHNLGYKVFIVTGLKDKVSVGESLELYLYQVVREDANDLYGFKDPAELKFFEKLLSVSGIGPKSALGIIGVAPVEELLKAIASGNETVFTNVSGIGGKSAQRIILELRGKLDNISSEQTGLNEEIEALVSLGYSSAQARDALRQVDSSITDTGERIKLALKNI